MNDLKQIDQTIRDLTGCTGRPFLCDGSPMGCKVALVGINPGTPTDFWACWNVKTGCDKSAWIQQYLAIHGYLKPTRDRIETFCEALRPERCLELNLTHHYTLDEASLSPDQIEDTRVFSYMMKTVRPKIVLVHGNKPIVYLQRVMNVLIAKETFIQAEYQDVPVEIYAAKSHFSRGISRQYVMELASEIRCRLLRHADRSKASGRPMNVIDFRLPRATVDFPKLSSQQRSRSGGDITKLNTIFGHIAKAQTKVCRRSKSNVDKQGGSIFDFKQRCKAEGYFFAELGDDVYAIKTKEALERFLVEHPDADVS